MLGTLLAVGAGGAAAGLALRRWRRHRAGLSAPPLETTTLSAEVLDPSLVPLYGGIITALGAVGGALAADVIPVLGQALGMVGAAVLGGGAALDLGSRWASARLRRTDDPEAAKIAADAGAQRLQIVDRGNALFDALVRTTTRRPALRRAVTELREAARRPTSDAVRERLCGQLNEAEAALAATEALERELQMLLVEENLRLLHLWLRLDLVVATRNPERVDEGAIDRLLARCRQVTTWIETRGLLPLNLSDALQALAQDKPRFGWAPPEKNLGGETWLAVLREQHALRRASLERQVNDWYAELAMARADRAHRRPGADLAALSLTLEESVDVAPVFSATPELVGELRALDLEASDAEATEATLAAVRTYRRLHAPAAVRAVDEPPVSE